MKARRTEGKIDNIRYLQAACLTGGIIIQVESPDFALEAQALGAVGVFLDFPLSDYSEEELRDSLGELSIHVVTKVEHQPFIEAAYSDGTRKTAPSPFYLVDPRHAKSTGLEQAILILETIDELSEIQIHSSILCASKPSLIPAIKAHQGIKQGALPIFCMAQTLSESLSALDFGAGGLFLTYMPTQVQMREIFEAIAGQPSQPLDLSNCPIGIVSLQGDYALQQRVLTQISNRMFDSRRNPISFPLIRSPEGLMSCAGIVLPGGWSNLQSQMMDQSGLFSALIDCYQHQIPILGICAGMILVSTRPGRHCEGRRMLGFIDARIENNQLSGSHEVLLPSGESFSTLFSNAPIATDLGEDVIVLARARSGEIVAMRENHVFAGSFHQGKGLQQLFLHHCYETFIET